MTLMFRIIFSAFSLITLLLTSAAVDEEGEAGLVLIPFRRSVLQNQQPVKVGEKVVADHAADNDPISEHLPQKLGIHLRKVRPGGGVATRARGKTSSAVRVAIQFSSFHFASLLACSFFLITLFIF
ncbi:hypothetical protein REPUB_Repub18cG0054000 [Reevesia pubescens]